MTDEAARPHGPVDPPGDDTPSSPGPAAATSPEPETTAFPPPGAFPPGGAHVPPYAAGPGGDAPPPPPWPPGPVPGAGFTSRYGLVRPREGRYLAGVCAAIGRATNTDPVLWRVLLAVLGFFGGIGILVYVAAWLVIPAEGDTASPVESMLGRGRSSMSPVTVIVLSILVAVMFGLIVTDRFRAVLLGAAILIGGALLLNRNGTGLPEQAPGRPGDGTPPGPPPVGMPGAAPGWPHPPGALPGWPPTPGTRSDVTVPLPVPAGSPATPSAPAFPAVPPGPWPPVMAHSAGPVPAVPTTAGPGWPPARPTTPPPPGPGYRPPFAPHGPYAAHRPPLPYPPGPPVRPPRPPKERSPLGAATFSLSFVAIGVVAILDLTNAVSVPPSGYFAAVLVTLGLGLLVGAWFGRARWLIALGLVVTAALGISTLVESYDRVRGFDDTREWRPTSYAALAERYETTLGEATLDLRAVDFTGHDAQVTVAVRMGTVRVVLPPRTDVTAVVNLRAGDATVFADRWSGAGGPPRKVTDLGTDGPGGGTLRLTVQVNAGDVEVTR